MKNSIILLSVFSILFFSCGENYKEKGTPEYIKQINDWHKERIENLKKPEGWLSLAGLLWLQEGENSFGTDKSNTIVFPKGESKMGSFILTKDSVFINIAEGVNILVDGNPVKKAVLVNDMQGKATVMKYKSLVWFLIKRGPKIGIRLKDTENPDIAAFKGIPRFPVNDDWKLEAKWEAYNPVKKLEIPNILGMVDTSLCYGAVVFNVEGKEYRLDAEGKDNLFIVFADATSGEETYGAGRFVAAVRDTVTNKVMIDFNKAYNPPCSVTKYATCPVPPDQNRLSLKITAGERFEGHH